MSRANRPKMPKERRTMPTSSPPGNQLVTNSTSFRPVYPLFENRDVDAAVQVFEILIRWRDEARKKGQIDW